MINEFYNEIVCYAMGGQCPASLAWLVQSVADNCAANAADALALRRAAAHWAAADESLRDALASYLAISQPLPHHHCPVPPAIASDYTTGLEWATQALAG